MRQQAWHGLDQARCGVVPFRTGEPTEAWAAYALAAPVMLMSEADRLRAVTKQVSFQEWLADPSQLGRQATQEDLDYHLTTLFPPVRPRGYLEIRCLDSLPDRWWPALAALTVTLVDDPDAADAAAELCESITGQWEDAARLGPEAPGLRKALVGCAEVAARHCVAELRSEVESFAELVASGRTPAGELRDRMERHGPLHVLEEEARA